MTSVIKLAGLLITDMKTQALRQFLTEPVTSANPRNVRRHFIYERRINMGKYLDKDEVYEKLKPKFENLNPDELYRALIEFKGNNETFFINEAIRKISAEETNKAWDLFVLLYEQNKEDFILTLVNGISKTKKNNEVMNFLLDKIDNEPLKVTNYFKTFQYENLTHIKKVINRIEEINLTTSIKKNIIVLYERMINNKLIKESDYKEKAFKKLKEFINYDNFDLYSQIIGAILRINIVKEKKFELLYPFAECGNEDLFQYNAIAYILKDIQTPKLVFKFLKEYIVYHNQIVPRDLIEYPLGEFFTTPSKELYLEYIDSLIHPSSLVRRLANDLFKKINIEDIQLQKLILDLDIQNQLKLIRAILPSVLDIKKRIRLLSILANSKSLFVITKLFGEFKELIRDYGYTVIEILEDQFSILNEKEMLFKNKIENFYKQFSELQETKNKIKEFNPKINQKDLMIKFTKTQNLKQKKEMQKARGESPFLGMIKKTSLLRGQSWKIEGQEDVSPLVSHKVEYLFPCRYYSNPEYYDYLYSKKRNENWGDK
jgi:hypothetical protein